MGGTAARAGDDDDRWPADEPGDELGDRCGQAPAPAPARSPAPRRARRPFPRPAAVIVTLGGNSHATCASDWASGRAPDRERPTTRRRPARPDATWSVRQAKERGRTHSRRPAPVVSRRGDEPSRQRIDMACGKTDQFARDRSPCWACSKTPAPATRSRAGEADCAQVTMAWGSLPNLSPRMRNSPVQASRPSSAQSRRRTASQPSQAPLPSSEIGMPQPPTRWVLSVDHRPADRAGAGNDDAAVAVTVGAEASGMRVGGDDRFAERVRIAPVRPPNRLGSLAPANARQATTFRGANVASRPGLRHWPWQHPRSRQSFARAETEICRTGRRLAENAGRRRRTAARGSWCRRRQRRVTGRSYSP